MGAPLRGCSVDRVSHCRLRGESPPARGKRKRRYPNRRLLRTDVSSSSRVRPWNIRAGCTSRSIEVSSCRTAPPCRWRSSNASMDGVPNVLGIALPVNGPSCADALRGASRVHPSLYDDWLGRWVSIADDGLDLTPARRSPCSIPQRARAEDRLSRRPPLWRSRPAADPAPSRCPSPTRLCSLGSRPVVRFRRSEAASSNRGASVRDGNGCLAAGRGSEERSPDRRARERRAGHHRRVAGALDRRHVGGRAAVRYGARAVDVGQDSRLILAAALAAGVTPTTFTFHKDRAHHGEVITLADSTVPRGIAHSRGLRHLYVRPQERNDRAETIIGVHTAGRFDGV